MASSSLRLSSRQWRAFRHSQSNWVTRTLRAIRPFARDGLPVASVIRQAKIATIDAADATELEAIGETHLRKVTGTIASQLQLQR